jgi:diguanylate cyclase (GGDEF)-like protein/PAS domain S-box-containing protein
MNLHKEWLDNLFDSVYVVDVNRTIIYWNKAAEYLTGFTEAEVIGKRCADNILQHVDFVGHELCFNGCPLHQTICDGQKREAMVFLHHKQGYRVPVHIRVSPIKNADGEIIGAVEMFSDHSHNSHVMKELEHYKKESLLDPLLNINNRRYAEMMFQVRRYESQITESSFGVIFMDIDFFKNINDTYGHAIGDNVLITVTRTVSNLLRHHVDTFARWGGDEFLICMPNVEMEGLKTVTERIRVLIENSFIMAGEKKISVAVSIGATIAKLDDTLESIVQRADSLLYQSKSSGRNKCTFG